MKYCEAIYETRRRRTREVRVGSVGIGGDNPVRIQSMTTSSTHDVDATIDQAIRLADAGCEIVRVTVQGIREAKACEGIKNGLIQRGYDIPLVADIHFYPPAALHVADFVDKVRINPGNFADKRATFKVIEYDDASYAEELIRIEEKFTPLVLKCKTLGRAMRIGTNHGSLSDRILNRYGDTPAGMVESALEFARICRHHDFHNIIFSMKASNPQVMIQAYRLLAAQMEALGWDYPLHLGVTEAGDGEDGRIKSAMGIGSLLLDGLGDTIRVSLTEDPWHEIDPCQRLVRLMGNKQGSGVAPFTERHRTIDTLNTRNVLFPKNVALHKDGTAIVPVSPKQLEDDTIYTQLGLEGTALAPKLARGSVDSVFASPLPASTIAGHRLETMQQLGVGTLAREGLHNTTRVTTLQEATRELHLRFAQMAQPGTPYILEITEADAPASWDALLSLSPAYILLSPQKNRLHYSRAFFDWIREHKLAYPIILTYRSQIAAQDALLEAAAELGALLTDGLGEGVLIDTPHGAAFNRNLAFGLLQAARKRIFKTEFISCPSCGRTLFDLQDVTKRIRSRTNHLPGVKIAIMGCIVNGPGEMADADFGYVGSRPGKIDLYVGKSCVEKNIDFADADDRLIDLIKSHDRWVDP